MQYVTVLKVDNNIYESLIQYIARVDPVNKKSTKHCPGNTQVYIYCHSLTNQTELWLLGIA